MNPRSGKVVIRDTSKRDLLIAVAIGLLVLGGLVLGISQLTRPVPGNRLTGKIIEKSFIPQKEHQVNFDGRKIEGVKDIDGEYLLKVRVESEQRTYEVPVEKPMYQQKQIGDSVTFLRPVSEQR